MSGLDRLHPALAFHIVNSLGWRTLRPLQEAAVEPVLAGATTLLTAPTAGGKTEAAVFPLLTRMLEEDWQPISLLYLCPLKALINDLEPRLSRYATLLGRRAALWHGDVAAAERRRLRREPPDVLLTTPESVEVMLLSQAAGRGALFRNLRAVVVDELHAFAGDDRGWHLLSVLERASQFAGRPIQRVGLSATIGNPQELATWLAGSSAGPTAVVDPASEQEAGTRFGGDSIAGVAGGSPAGDGSTGDADVKIDFVGHLDNAAIVISRLHRGEKRLVFCDSRTRVESLSFKLRELGVRTFVSHGSLGLEERRAAERAFAEARDCVIVATSTLELGIDVGDLDRVLQIDAPGTVASFLQRLGRTGRRPGARRNLLFLATREDDLLKACALVCLWQQGYVEPLEPPPLPYTVFGQQLLALVIQQSGLARPEWQDWVGRLPVYRDFPEGTAERVISYMLAEALLFEDSGVLGLGPEGERRFTGKAFLDLLSVFSTDPLFSVLHGRTEIGKVAEASFLQSGEEGPILLLGGRSWRVLQIDWNEAEAYVEPIDRPGRSLWPGSGPPLGYQVCEAMREVLTEGPEQAALQERLTRRAGDALAGLAEQFSWLPREGTVLVQETRSRTRWWTFAGLRANATLGDHMKAQGAPVIGRDNLGLNLDVAPQAKRLQKAIQTARASEEDLLPLSLAAEAAETMKFHFCVPQELLLTCLRRRLADPRAVRAALRSDPVVVQPSA